MTALRITVRSHSGHLRTFSDETAAAKYSAALTAADQNVLISILFPDGDLVEFAAVVCDLPDGVELDLNRLVAVESEDGMPQADQVARALFPRLAP